MKKILVTGGAGYIGSVLTRKLLDQGYSVRVIDNLRFGGSSLDEVKKNPNFELVVADIRDKGKVDAAIKGVYGVINLASIVGDPACQKEPELAKEINYDAAVYLLEAAQKNDVKRFVFASTCSNYGKMKEADGYVDETSPLTPVSLYARLKVEFENHFLSKDYSGDFAVTGLRFATAYGLSPRMRFDLTVNEFTKELSLERELVVFGEQFWRPYCHVNDISKACMLVLEAERNIVHKNVYNVGDSSENYQKETIVHLIKQRLPKANVKYVHKNEDPRDYRVKFEKIKNQLQFSITMKVDNGIDEIMTKIKEGSFKEPDSHIYKNS